MFNWDTRYAKLLKNWSDQLEQGSVLEVGSGPSGIARYLKNTVTGAEIDDIQSCLPNLQIVKEDVTKLSFEDNSFDYVICSDVLEHLTYEQRSSAVDECIRVSKKKCFIQGPHGNLARIGELNLKLTLENAGRSLPSWLLEHLQNGMPQSAETIDQIFKSGFQFSILVNETATQHFSAVLMDLLFSNASMFYQMISTKNKLADFHSFESDIPYSLLFIVEKNKPLKEAVDNFNRVKIKVNNEVDNNKIITHHSIHHKISGLENISNLIKPFFVNDMISPGYTSLINPSGVLEESNERASEVSAIHYIWRKKLFSDIVGISHYRRYLYLFPEEISDFYIHINPDDFKNYLKKIEDKMRINELLANYDILISKPRVLDDLSIEDHYSCNHFPSDYYKCIEIILNNYPYLESALVESMQSNSLYNCNLFYCNALLFDEFCKVWFDILDKYAYEVDVSGRNQYQKRDIAFLSERVFDIIVRHLKKIGFKTCELPILAIHFEA